MSRADKFGSVCSHTSTPLVLHACCGPCALEPLAQLKDEGFEPVLFWANPNIQPYAEWQRRYDTLCDWAAQAHIKVVSCECSARRWEQAVAPFAREVLRVEQHVTANADAEDTQHNPRNSQHSRLQAARVARCSACYRLRLEATCYAAAKQGFHYVSTTLAVSPYQLFDVCTQELCAAAKRHGLEAVVRDFRPRYQEGRKRSLELGMYRQKYCGCRFSAVEAQDGRLRAREKRKAKKEELQREN